MTLMPGRMARRWPGWPGCSRTCRLPCHGMSPQGKWSRTGGCWSRRCWRRRCSGGRPGR
jgi:hypothetical protein